MGSRRLFCSLLNVMFARKSCIGLLSAMSRSVPKAGRRSADGGPVAQVKGSLIKSGYFGPDLFSVATPLLLPMDLKQTFSGSKLVRKQI